MPDPSQLAAVVIAGIGAVVTGWASLTRPAVAIASLYILASLSRLVVETPIGSMRLEQPAIAVTAVILLARGGLDILRTTTRTERLIGGAFLAYLGVLGLSSALIAPHPAESLRQVAWLAISMAGGLVTYALARSLAADGGILPLAFGGAARAASGLLVAGLFLVVGPAADLGIQESAGILPRVHGFAWEANIFGSFLAITLPFAIEAAHRPWGTPRARAIGVSLLVLVVIGLPLAMTRGAYLGAAAGVVAYLVSVVALERRPATLIRPGAIAAVSLAIGLVVADLLLPNALERYIADTPPAPTPTPLAVGESPGSPGGSSAGGTTAPPPTIRPVPSLRPYPDTIGFRLERLPVALADMQSSPLIGLGAESFGQRHVDPTQEGGKPDHLAIMAIAVPYDAGLLGTAALAIGFLALIVALLRRGVEAARSRAPSIVGTTAAFLAAVVAMLVAYQATNAIHFASNWVILGAAVAILHRRAGPEVEGSTDPV